MGWLEDWLEKHGIMEETMPEWDEPDGLSPEDAWGQLAKETYPELDLGDEPTDLTTLGGNAILKEIHFENSSKESSFQKYINWLLDNGIASVSREGEPLGDAVTLGGTQMLDKDGRPTTQLLDLRAVSTQNKLFDFFEENWMTNRNIKDELQQRLQNGISQMVNFAEGKNMDEYNWDPDNAISAEVDPETLTNIIRVFGDLGIAENKIANLNAQLGANALQTLVARTFAPVLRNQIKTLSQKNRAILIGPNVGVVGDQMTDADAIQPMTAWVTSFDGTPFGEIESVNDLFSGGRVGPQDAWFYMQKLYEGTRNASGYSEVVERIQQELFAYGYMDAPREWGKLDIINMENKADATIDALQMLQSDQINEALNVPKGQLAPDGSAYLKDVMDRAMSNKLNQLPKRKAVKANQQTALVEQVIGNLETLATRAGRVFDEEGKAKMRTAIKGMISSEEDQDLLEEAFGGGGSAKDLQKVDLILKNFYQDDNWANNVYLGANDSDVDYFRYAKRSGALSDEELEQFLATKNFRTSTGTLDDSGVRIEEITKPMYSTNFDDTGSLIDPVNTNAVAKDVLTSFMLDLLAAPDGQEADMAKALMTFGHTAGARISSDFGYTAFDYEEMANKISSDLALASEPEESELASTLSDRLAKANDLTGRGTALQALTGGMRQDYSTTAFNPLRNV